MAYKPLGQELNPQPSQYNCTTTRETLLVSLFWTLFHCFDSSVCESVFLNQEGKTFSQYLNTFLYICCCLFVVQISQSSWRLGNTVTITLLCCCNLSTTSCLRRRKNECSIFLCYQRKCTFSSIRPQSMLTDMETLHWAAFRQRQTERRFHRCFSCFTQNCQVEVDRLCFVSQHASTAPQCKATQET